MAASVNCLFLECKRSVNYEENRLELMNKREKVSSPCFISHVLTYPIPFSLINLILCSSNKTQRSLINLLSSSFAPRS